MAGQRWDWDGVRFAVLHPPAAYYDTPGLKTNDLSCVVRVDSDFGSALLTGDIEARSEAQLLRDDPQALAVDVLVVPHHGSRTSSTPEFIAATRRRSRCSRRAIAIASGTRARTSSPVIRRRCAVPSTDFDGALTFEFAPGAAPTRAERTHDRRYWREAPVREASAAPD